MSKSGIVVPQGATTWEANVALSTTDSNVVLEAAPGTGLSLYITDIVISIGATAGNVTLQDEDDTTLFGPIYAPVNGGAVISLSKPIQVAANKALEFDKSAACDEGTIYCAGYVS